MEHAFTKVKKMNKMTYLGGALSQSSKNFIRHLYNKGLLDYIETRFIIMKLNDDLFDVYDDAIKSSHEFELKWSQYLHTKYSEIATSLNSRISLIQPRVNKSFSINDTRVCYNLEEMKNDTLPVKALPSNYVVKFTDKNVNSFLQDTDCVIVDRKISHVICHDFVYQIDALEDNKSIETVMDIINFMSYRPVSRVVVIGGGLVQDIGSFTSAIFNRGIEWIYFPTTLLAMADSCIGSKSSLNTTVKNKIGTFYSPSAVYINTKFLDTLDYRDIQSGMGEILKLCMIGDALGMYEKYKFDITSLIKLSLIIKRAVIEVDQFDMGIRRALNYGHTIGHAIEKMSNYTVPHGIAVVHGMIIVNKLFGYSDKLFDKLCNELVTSIDNEIKFENISQILLNDKKAVRNGVNFVVPVAPGIFEIKFYEINDELCKDIKGYLT